MILRNFFQANFYLIVIFLISCNFTDKKKFYDLDFLEEKEAWRDVQKLCENQDIEYKERNFELLKKYKNEISLNPESSLYYFLLGRLSGLLGEPQKSKFFFEIALKKDPEFVWGHYGLGLYYLKTGENFKAKAYFSKCLLYIPDFAPAFIGIAKLEENNPNLALANLKEAHKYMPENPEILLYIAQILIALDNKNEAESYYLKAFQIAPENLNILKKVAFFFMQKKEYSRARDFFLKILNLTKSEKERKNIEKIINNLLN